ncbi:hypothetical protein Bca4012_058196 [Brassica carinata]|uniref:Uncharacterized protein n=1 Tax=Brassica carinata TaxID=52824 RepID=A0A8X7W447_BRACI|nr:hypothetical protein Bca52824_055423 [Brassica carinata]KAG2322714.1 hypothetical protein Bca52824_015927 [Brassica carinata]
MKAEPFGVLTKDATEVSESERAFRMKITVDERKRNCGWTADKNRITMVNPSLGIGEHECDRGESDGNRGEAEKD